MNFDESNADPQGKRVYRLFSPSNTDANATTSSDQSPFHVTFGCLSNAEGDIIATQIVHAQPAGVITESMVDGLIPDDEPERFQVNMQINLQLEHPLHVYRNAKHVGLSMPEVFLSSTSNGWQDSRSFLAFMDFTIARIEEYRNRHPLCDETTPMVLFMDNHFSRSYDALQVIALMERCESKSIYISYLPPHLSHVLQPNDKGLHSHMKSVYTHAIQYELALQKAKGTRNWFSKISKADFNRAYMTTMAIVSNCKESKRIIREGYRISGLMPREDSPEFEAPDLPQWYDAARGLLPEEELGLEVEGTGGDDSSDTGTNESDDSSEEQRDHSDQDSESELSDSNSNLAVRQRTARAANPNVNEVQIDLNGEFDDLEEGHHDRPQTDVEVADGYSTPEDDPQQASARKRQGEILYRQFMREKREIIQSCNRQLTECANKYTEQCRAAGIDALSVQSTTITPNMYISAAHTLTQCQLPTRQTKKRRGRGVISPTGNTDMEAAKESLRQIHTRREEKAASLQAKKRQRLLRNPLFTQFLRDNNSAETEPLTETLVDSYETNIQNPHFEEGLKQRYNSFQLEHSISDEIPKLQRTAAFKMYLTTIGPGVDMRHAAINFKGLPKQAKKQLTEAWRTSPQNGPAVGRMQRMLKNPEFTQYCVLKTSQQLENIPVQTLLTLVRSYNSPQWPPAMDALSGQNIAQI